MVGLAVDPKGRERLLEISNEILESVKVRNNQHDWIRTSRNYFLSTNASTARLMQTNW